MRSIPRRNVVALQMQRDVLERHWISIDVQSPDLVRIISVVLSLLELALKELGKV
jgi:hypothetical protein